MTSAGVRRRLASASYEGNGRASKQQLRDCPLAVYEETPRTEEVARLVARLQEERCADGGAFYVMDACSVEARLLEWREALHFIRPFYHMRCNADPLLLQLLTRSRDCNIVVSSLAELDAALSFVPPSRISFHAPLVTRKTLRLLASLQEPLHSVVLDCEDSIIDMGAMAPFQPCLLRVSLSPDAEQAELAMGMPVEEVCEGVARILREGGHLAGLSLQLQTGDREQLVARAESAVLLLRSLSSLGVSLSLLDVGGRFRRPSLDEAAVVVEYILANSEMPTLKAMACPGRFFASSAFSLVTSIIGKHPIDARIITRDEADRGSPGFVYETNESFYGAMGGHWLGGEAPECESLREEPQGERLASAVLGSSRDKMDVPQRSTRLPSLAVGDWLLWKEMGAYGAREECVPVYYFTERSHWLRLQSEEGRLHSDGGSDAESEEGDLSECFGRVFSH